MTVGWSKHGGITELSLPDGSIISTIVPDGASQPPTPSPPLKRGFSAARRSLPTDGSDVPAMRYWCAGKLGPWFVWNMRSANVYCSAIWKYGATDAGFT